MNLCLVVGVQSSRECSGLPTISVLKVTESGYEPID